MRLKHLLGVFAAVLALSATAAFAQQPAPEASATPAVTAPAPAPSPTTVSGRLYLQWMKELENADPENTRSINTFSITRAYLTVKHQFDQNWTAVITLDALNDGEASVNSGSGTSSDTRYRVFVKNAYLQGAWNLGFANVTTQFGMVGTAVIGLIDKVSDYRWLNANYLDSAKTILAQTNATLGRSIDTSADLGVSVSVAVANMVTVTGQYTNGDGYKNSPNADTGVEKDGNGHSYLGMLTLTPVEGLYIAGYMRQYYHNGADMDNNLTQYYGGTLAYSVDFIKIGASYILGSRENGNDTATTKDEYRIIDAFLLANLNQFIGLPVLLAGRYAIGHTELDNGSTVDATVWAAGIGYQARRGVRFMAYYEVLSTETDVDGGTVLDNNNDQRRLYLKCETSF